MCECDWLTRSRVGQQRQQLLLGACLLLIVSMPLVVAGGSSSTDAAVLQQFATQYNVAAWLNSTAPRACAGWQGVACDSTGRVTSLQLTSVGIAGQFPDFLYQLDGLNVLKLATGQLHGTLPDSWPQAFPSLIQLDLSANNISGGVPESWMATGSFPSLSSLNLQGAFNKKTTRALPFSAGQAGMASLVTLNLGLCNITGPLTVTWGQGLSNLTSLVLSNNMLTGQLPDTWGTTTGIQLTQLLLDGNQLTGQVNPVWGVSGSFTQLQWLSLAHNNLTSSVPTAWGAPASLPSLQTLQLNDNNLTGTLPATWGQSSGLSQLATVYLQGNSLTGGIPLSWTNNRSSLAKYLRPGNVGMCEAIRARLAGVRTFGTTTPAVSCLDMGCNQDSDVAAALAVGSTEGCVVTVNADHSIETSAGCATGISPSQAAHAWQAFVLSSCL